MEKADKGTDSASDNNPKNDDENTVGEEMEEEKGQADREGEETEVIDLDDNLFLEAFCMRCAQEYVRCAKSFLVLVVSARRVSFNEIVEHEVN